VRGTGGRCAYLEMSDIAASYGKYRRVTSSQRLEESYQDSSFVRGHLRQQADDFEKGSSGTLCVTVCLILLALAAFVPRD